MSCHFRSIEVSDPHSPSGFGAPITTFSATSKTLSLSLNVTGTPTSVQVFQQLASPPTTKDAATNDAEGFALKPPVFTESSTDPDRKAEIERAHQAAYFMAKVAVRELTEGPSAYTNQCLMTWFGTSTDTQALEAILNNYRKIVAVMESENVIYDFSHPQTADSDNDAFVTGIGATWNKTIYVAAGFWSGDMNMSGPDSLAGTIIHELAHGVDMAQDFAEAWYGAEPTKRLAKLNMKANIVHADAIARFSEALNPFSGYWRDAKTGKLYHFVTEKTEDGTYPTVNEVTDAGEERRMFGPVIFAPEGFEKLFLFCYATEEGVPGNIYLEKDLVTLVHYLDGKGQNTLHRTVKP